MDDATVLHACRLLHEALCDDLVQMPNPLYSMFTVRSRDQADAPAISRRLGRSTITARVSSSAMPTGGRSVTSIMRMRRADAPPPIFSRATKPAG